MIEVKHLYKSFEDREVLKDINTVFEDGKTNLIIGQSGSGKTVLMKNLVGLLEPTRGEILYDGRNFVSMSKHEKVMMRREMGMIFQSAALFDSMTVLENVMFPLDMFRRAQDCLDRVNLTGADEKFPGEISGGMQKRVAIARAIALNPKYLFCDEPNSGLDPKTSLVIDELLHSITQEYNMTTIINTHDMNHFYLRRKQGMARRKQSGYGGRKSPINRLYLRQRSAQKYATNRYRQRTLIISVSRKNTLLLNKFFLKVCSIQIFYLLLQQ